MRTNHHAFLLCLFIGLGLNILSIRNCKPILPPLPEYIAIEVCTESGLLPNEWCPAKETRLFEKGAEPTSICQIHKAPEYILIEICAESGLLANPWCPIKEIKSFTKGQEPTGYCTIHKRPEAPPRLAIRDGKICYRDGGTVPIILCGVSRWEALWREKGLYHDWGPYSLAWYEEELGKYGINYVRHGAIENFDFVYEHCRRLKDKGIIVELTVFRGLEEGRLMELSETNIRALAGLGNVFFDCHNEFTDSLADVYEAKAIADIIAGYGCIVSGGAYGASSNGEQNAAFFHQICSSHQISTVHRQWTSGEIQNALKYGKPVIRNEYFDRGKLGLEIVKQIMRETFDVGGQGCQYYGFAIPGLGGLIAPDPFDYRAMLEFAGQLTRKLNPD